MPNPKPFQILTAQYIAGIFLEARESERRPRFLLADEVGLGKTIVAQDVIRILWEKGQRPSGREHMNIVYFACSLDIARQNREKLIPASTKAQAGLPGDEKDYEIDRLTLFPFEEGPKGKIRIFSFTPGTSLDLGRATGRIEERKYLLALVFRYLREQLGSEAPWDEDFKILKSALRGGAEKSWDDVCNKLFGDQASSFRWDEIFKIDEKSSEALVKDLFALWSTRLQEMLASHDPASLLSARTLIDFLRPGKDGGKGKDKASQRSCHFIRVLRESLALQVIQLIRPDLVIMDEFHRFDELLYEKVDPRDEGDDSANVRLDPGRRNLLVNELLTKRSFPVLLMSATPYRIVPSAMFEGDPHESFYTLLQMLAGPELSGESLESLKALFVRYRESLCGTKDTATTLKEIEDAKLAVEQILRRYICRTERFYYEHSGSICERQLASESAVYRADHLQEYFDLEGARRRIEEKSKSAAMGRPSLEYWKSGGHLSTFGGGYAWMPNPSEKEALAEIPKVHLSKIGNPKLRYLHQQCTNTGAKACLWVLPSRVSGQRGLASGLFAQQPRKYLVFSAWRFVPTMIAASISAHHEPRDWEGAPRESLRAEDWVKLFVPDALRGRCRDDESWWLKRVGESAAHEKDEEAGEDDAVGSAEPKKGSEETKEGDKNRWKARRSAALRLGDEETPRWTPGNALYTAALRYLSPPEGAQYDLADLENLVVSTCIGTCSRYFMGPFQAAVMRSAIPEGDYVDRLRAYLAQGLFHEVIDEYVFLLAKEYAPKTKKRLMDLFDEFKTAMSLAPGKIDVAGAWEQPAIRNRIAADFNGRDRSTDDPSGADRKRNLRMAFNSPFYPFVLASTSVGQEGLDFHRYCQDIVHWDLPGSPEAFEQREGRIRRFLGRSVRRAIADDYVRVRQEVAFPLDWEKVLAKIDSLPFTWENETSRGQQDSRPLDYFKNGVYPAWIYSKPGAEKDAQFATVRHLLCLPFSGECRRWEELNARLDTYRFALGQKDPEETIRHAADLIERFRQEGLELKPEQIRALCISLSPSTSESYWKLVTEVLWASEKFKSLPEATFAEECTALLNFADNWISASAHRLGKLGEVGRDLCDLTARVVGASREWISLGRVREVPLIVWQLLHYLISPYDGSLDHLLETGLADDVGVFTKQRDHLEAFLEVYETASEERKTG